MDGMTDARKLEILAIQSIMASEGGRKFMQSILAQTGVGVSAFDPDPYIHARNAGTQVVGHWLMQELQLAAPDQYLRMLKEQQNG